MSISRKHVVFLSVLSCGLFSFNASAAGDLYVSVNNGSDASTNPGTDPAHPLKSINRSAALVKAGMTVHVAPGTYYETVNTRVSGSATARVRYVSDTPFAAKVIGSGTEAMWTASGSYNDIVGFDISGPGRLGINNGGSYVQIIGNHIHDLAVSGGCTGNGGAGIDNSNYQSVNNDIIGNIVHDIGTPGACNGVHAIYHAMSGGKIMNNVTYRASSFGIHLWHAAKNAVVMNNSVFDNGSSSMGGGIVLGSGDGGGYNGTDESRIDNVIVANNIVYKNPASSITEYCYPKQPCIGPNIQIVSNLVNGNGQGIHLLGGTPASGMIDADPMFVNYQINGSGDFHLKKGSPAIDKGKATGAPSTDLDGQKRPQGSGVDIGAYEYVGMRRVRIGLPRNPTPFNPKLITR